MQHCSSAAQFHTNISHQVGEYEFSTFKNPILNESGMSVMFLYKAHIYYLAICCSCSLINLTFATVDLTVEIFQGISSLFYVEGLGLNCYTKLKLLSRKNICVT